MWNWFSCYLSGRHQYGVWCEPGAVFLRCAYCGKRSSGWSLAKTPKHQPAAVNAPPSRTRVLPFDRAVAQ
jgi:hypothetical protein